MSKPGDFIHTLVVGRWFFLQSSYIVPLSARSLLRRDGRTDVQLQRSRKCQMSEIPLGTQPIPRWKSEGFGLQRKLGRRVAAGSSRSC